MCAKIKIYCVRKVSNMLSNSSKLKVELPFVRIMSLSVTCCNTFNYLIVECVARKKENLLFVIFLIHVSCLLCMSLLLFFFCSQMKDVSSDLFIYINKEEAKRGAKKIKLVKVKKKLTHEIKRNMTMIPIFSHRYFY